MAKKERKNLMGKKFHYWTVINDAPDVDYMVRGRLQPFRVVVAKCKCGTTRSVLANNLLCGFSRSCGCYQRERASESAKRYQEKMRSLRSISNAGKY